MHGHKLTLKFKLQEAPKPEGGPAAGAPSPAADLFGPPGRSIVEAEVLLDGQKLRLVQRVAVSIDAESMVPTVFLAFVPTELDVEMDCPAEVYKALGQAKAGFMHDLFGVLTPVPVAKPVGVSAQVQAAFDEVDRLVACGRQGEPVVVVTGADGVPRQATPTEFADKLRLPNPNG